MLSECKIPDADSYSKECELSSCEAGWKLNEGKSECIGNQHSCANGVASSGIKCLADGAP